jgi:hypothetical protein
MVQQWLKSVKGLRNGCKVKLCSLGTKIYLGLTTTELRVKPQLTQLSRGVIAKSLFNLFYLTNSSYDEASNLFYYGAEKDYGLEIW